MQSDSALDEIVGFINASGRTTRDQILRMVCGYYNVRTLGEGHYSAVIEHPYDRSKVVKIGFGGNRGCEDYREDGWVMFAFYAMQNPASSFSVSMRCDAKPNTTLRCLIVWTSAMICLLVNVMKFGARVHSVLWRIGLAALTTFVQITA